MPNDLNYKTARTMALDAVTPVGTEQIPLCRCGGRILAADLTASENIPPFDRSPYDGYALRSADTAEASPEHPVALSVTMEIPAGGVAAGAITPGTAAKVLTGAPIPPGADGVVMFEKTQFTGDRVTLFAPLKEGENIVRTGEDVAIGTLLAEPGTAIDPGLAGTLAAQGVATPTVYRLPRVGILSTGSELVEAGSAPGAGQIRNSNLPMLEAALLRLGCVPVDLGIAGDSVEDIACRLCQGLESCDAIITTGGVSVGDYDLTPAAMEAVGADILFRGVDMKPGMACAYAVKEGRLICGLSGNPASSMTNFYAIALPALKKLAGHRDCLPREITVTLKEGFSKKSPKTRLLRGRLDLSGGTVAMDLPADQGNVVLSSTIGCNVMAEVPAGSGKLPAGTVLKGFLL